MKKHELDALDNNAVASLAQHEAKGIFLWRSWQILENSGTDHLQFDISAYEKGSHVMKRVQVKGVGSRNTSNTISLSKGHQGSTATRELIRGREYGRDDFDLLAIVLLVVVNARWPNDEGVYLLDWPENFAERIHVKHLHLFKARDWSGWNVEPFIEPPDDRPEQIDYWKEEELEAAREAERKERESEKLKQWRSVKPIKESQSVFDIFEERDDANDQ